MYAARGLLLAIFGFTTLKFIRCYSDGSILSGECPSMEIDHGANLPQAQDSNPFTVVPDNVIVSNSSGSNVGTIFTVTLSTTSFPFTGFMLDARECDGSNCPPAGMFSLLDRDHSLLLCDDKAVAQPNNLEKTSLQVNWTAKATGQFFFRSAFIQNYAIFWLKKAIILPTTIPTTTTIRSTTTTASTSTTTPATRSTATTATTSSPLPQRVQYMRGGLGLLLFSRLCFLGGSSLLMIIKPVPKMLTAKIASIIELALKLIATILVLIKVAHHDCENAGCQTGFTALTVTAMVSSLMHSITVFLYRGPSHELRKCWIGSFIIVDLLNTVITTISIFYGLCWFQERWMPILMGVYVILEFTLYLGAVCFEQIDKHKAKRARQNLTVVENMKIPRRFMFAICLVFYAMFTVALIVGVSSHVMRNC